MTPEAKARQQIDAKISASGWLVRTKDKINLSASRGVAVCELSLATGEPDYTLFVDGKAIGTTEAKPKGATFTGVEEQSTQYVSGVPFGLPAWKSPLPFCRESTGMKTLFTNRLDPDPRSRRVAAFHRPETLLAWAQQEKQLAQRLREFPPLAPGSLWLAQIEAITGLEKSFAAGLLRALIQMATGSGKTDTAVNFIYRLVKYAGAKRVLFLVDRGNLGRQTPKEFQQFVSPVNNYKFTEEYIVQHLSGSSLDKSARVVIGTIQRMYSMRKGEKGPAPDLDDLPLESLENLAKVAAQSGSGVPPRNQADKQSRDGSATVQSGSGVPPRNQKEQSRDGFATFTPEQLAWPNLIRGHFATAISIEPEDLELSPFNQHGGLGKAHQLFGEQLPKLLDELNQVLAA